MNSCNMASIAKMIYDKKANQNTPYSQSQRNLIIRIYNAYLYLTATESASVQIVTEGDAWDACDELYKWYSKRYIGKGKEEEDNRGISKNVSFKDVSEGTYHFDKTYEKRQFEKYFGLVKGKNPARNEDFLAFILHVAVAFYLKPADLDITLKDYGFQQLHVRNIHHLAIYATLSQLELKPKSEALTINPFRQVRLYYEIARAILNNTDPMGAVELFEGDAEYWSELLKKKTGEWIFYEDQTKWIRENYLGKELNPEKFVGLIKQNKASFTMRHKTILDDHHRFASLYRYLFDKPINLGKKIGDESDYSFYKFTDSFCCKHSQKKFREKIFDHIDKNGKHPTRELMICFWLYAFCFAYSDGVYLGDNLYNSIYKRLGQIDSNLAGEFEECVNQSHNHLNLLKFVYGEKIERKTDFSGADIVDFIRKKLRDDYQWGTLDSRNKFDYYILQLQHLEFRIGYSGRPFDIRYNGIPVQFTVYYPDVIPGALVVVFELFEHLKFFDEFPLKCNIYEQM